MTITFALIDLKEELQSMEENKYAEVVTEAETNVSSTSEASEEVKLYSATTRSKYRVFRLKMAVAQRRCILAPLLEKPAKMGLRGGIFFNFRKFVYIFQLFVYNFSKRKTTASQTHFGFTNIGSEMLSFRGTAI